MDMPGGLTHFIAQTYLGKFTEGFLFTPCGSEITANRSTCGLILPPPGYVMRASLIFNFKHSLRLMCLVNTRPAAAKPMAELTILIENIYIINYVNQNGRT